MHLGRKKFTSGPNLASAKRIPGAHALFILNMWTSKAALEEPRPHLMAWQAELKSSETTDVVALLVYLLPAPTAIPDDWRLPVLPPC